MEGVELLISTLCIFHFNLVLIASMSTELKITHGMQLLVWPRGSIFFFFFVCVLARVQQRTGATYTVMDSLLCLYNAAKCDLSGCCRGQEFFCSFNSFRLG